MAFDKELFAAKAKAALKAAQTPGFEPAADKDLPAEQQEQQLTLQQLQIKGAIADAVKRAAVHSIAIGIAERSAELWPGLDATPAEVAKAAEGADNPLDVAVHAAIGAYMAVVKE